MTQRHFSNWDVFDRWRGSLKCKLLISAGLILVFRLQYNESGTPTREKNAESKGAA